MNSFNITGRIANEPLKFTNKSSVLAKFTLAVRSSYKNKDGEYKTDFLGCSAWGKTAELIINHCAKGMMIGVTGRIGASEYEKNGVKIYNNDLIADSIDFLQSKSNSSAKNESKEEIQENDFGGIEDSDEDNIPF